tara:strand:- start:3293 stop:3646 length:354 start_codon:yes stop_codon:yes gene_type:complete
MDQKKIVYKHSIWGKSGEKLEKSYKKIETIIESSPTEKKELQIETAEVDETEIIDYRCFIKDTEKPENDKQICNERLGGRERLIRTTINPFLTKSNYVNDLTVQDEFLRPKNSSYKE